MPKRIAKPATRADIQLVARACDHALVYMRCESQEDWMRPYFEGLDQALANVRAAVKRDQERAHELGTL